MKKIKSSIVILFSLLSFSAQASLINLVFENGWKVEFNDNIISATSDDYYTNSIYYSDPTINNTGNDLVHYEYKYNNSFFVDFSDNSAHYYFDIHSQEYIPYYSIDLVQFSEQYYNDDGEYNYNTIIGNADLNNISLFDNSQSIVNSLISTLGINDFYSTYSTNSLYGSNSSDLTTLDSIYIDGAKVSTIPIPTAVWLFGSGLLGMLSIKKKR